MNGKLRNFTGKIGDSLQIQKTYLTGESVLTLTGSRGVVY